MRKNNFSLLLIIWGLIFIMIFSVFYIDFKIKASLIEIAKAKVQLTGAKVINQVINEKVVSQVEYKDIVYVHKDDKGRIALIQPNTLILNQIMTSAVIEITNYLEEMENDYIQIPLGQITGSSLLSGYGPLMKVKIIPTAEIHVEVLNKFEQAGINQTRHLIYFQIDNNLQIAVPFLQEKVEVVTTIPLAETIIVGDVPDTYVDFKGANEMLYPFIEKR